MFKWFKNKKRRKKLERDWQLVKILEQEISWKDIDEKSEVFYYLYENGLGSRQIEIKEPHDYRKCGKMLNNYLLKAYPWSKGTNYSDIPSYWDTRKNKNEKYVWELYRQLLGN